MEFRSLAIVGFGDLGERVARRLHPQHWRCHGLRRNAQAVPAGVRGVAVDFEEPHSLAILEHMAPDALLIALSPAERSEAGYRRGFDGAMGAILDGLGAYRPSRAFFVSSTRVYAERDGALIDEDAALATEDPFARAIIDAETRFLDALDGATVLRAGGLYGHGPGPLLKRVAAGRLTPRMPLRFGNRIHRDDVAGLVVSALEKGFTDRVLNLVDDEPAPIQEVEAWLCDALGRPYEPVAEDAARGPVNHKRISNQRLRASGYDLEYASFREGYADVLHRWMAHSEREDGLDLH